MWQAFTMRNLQSSVQRSEIKKILITMCKYKKIKTSKIFCFIFRKPSAQGQNYLILLLVVVCTFISLHAAVNFYQPCSCVYVCYSVYHRQVDRERRAFPSHNWLFTHLDKKVCGISCNSPTSPVAPKVPALVNTITIITCRHKKVCTHAKSLHLPPTPIFPMLGQKKVEKTTESYGNKTLSSEC